MSEVAQPAFKGDMSKIYPTKGSDWFALKNVVFENPEAPWEDVWEESDDIRFLRSCGGVFVNDAFFDLWNITSGLMFLDGGYGSSKTTYVITRLLVKCLQNKKFRCFYGRQTKVDARKLHSNIISEIKRNGWEKYFDYSERPTGSLEIFCTINDNRFKAFGCEDPDFIKGMDSETTDILVDEINQISWESFGMLFTRLRGNSGADLQMYGCFNNCDVYSDHWLRKFIYIKEGNELKVESEADKKVLDALLKTNTVKHHSIYTDNWFQNNSKYYNSLVIKAGGDDTKIKAYCNGDWGVELASKPFYKMFNKDRQASWVEYSPDLDLHISFDENLNPYLPCIIGQLVGNEVRIIDEIAAKNPYNSIEWVCGELLRRYKGEKIDHEGKVYIYGDATSKKEDVKLEKGANFYTLIAKFLIPFKNLVFRNVSSNPNPGMRQDFINACFGLDLVKIRIHPKCDKLIEDFQNTKETSVKGKRGKDKKVEEVDGVKGVQRYGHLSDAFDYFICEARMDTYILYQTGNISHDVVGGKRDVRSDYDGKKKIYSEKYEDMEDGEEDEIFERPSKNGW